MRKAIFIFIAVIFVAVSIDWIHSCADLKSHKEVFGRYLTYADMYEYRDKDYVFFDKNVFGVRRMAFRCSQTNTAI